MSKLSDGFNVSVYLISIMSIDEELQQEQAPPSAIGVVSYSPCKHDIAVQQQMIFRHIIEQAQTTTLRLESAAYSS